jgi:hypothetical protein
MKKYSLRLKASEALKAERKSEISKYCKISNITFTISEQDAEWLKQTNIITQGLLNG